MQLNISDIQHFSLGDGSGIRTTVFFKGCNLHCPWCHNPEAVSREPVWLHYPNLAHPVRCGRLVEPAALLPELLADKAYYDESGGGVTFSGGESLLQADGAAELAALLRENGVSVTVDTAGCVPYSAFQKLHPYTDTYLFDYKSASADTCRDVCGGDLARITDNLARLLASGKTVRLRIPLIPGFNTDSASTEAICLSLRELGVRAVDLLPFHRLGSSKYEALRLPYAYRDVTPLSKETLSELENRFAVYFTVTVEN